MMKLKEMINELCPNGVEFKKFGEIAQISRGASPRPIKNFITTDENGVNWVKIGDVAIGSKYITGTNEKITQEGAKKSRAVHKGDFILSNSMSFGRPYIMKIDGCIHDGWLSISEFEEFLISDFLYYVLVSAEIQNEMRKRASFGGAVQNLNADIVRELMLPVPPLEVQREIVQILDKFTLLSAELSAELSARQKQYEYYRDKLINGADGVKGKLIDMLEKPVTDGPHTTPQLYPNGVPFISATAVYDGKVHLEDMKGYISKEFDEECAKKYKPRKHDVFMVKSGSTTGKVAYVDFDDDFNVWSPIAAMRTNDSCSSRYLYHLLQTTTIQNQVKERMSKGSQPNLSMRVIEQFDVIIPSLEEQERIVAILDKMDDLCYGFKKGIPAEMDARQKQYEYYRDKLLTFEEVS